MIRKEAIFLLVTALMVAAKGENEILRSEQPEQGPEPGVKMVRILSGGEGTDQNVQTQQRPGYYQGSWGDQNFASSGQKPVTAPKPKPTETKKVAPIYVEIMNAIEILVNRVNKLEKRLATVENVALYLSNNKENPTLVQGSCPKDFFKVDGMRSKCFHVSTLVKDPALFDWKSATNECARMGARLVELSTYDDFERLRQFLRTVGVNKKTQTTDFWTGGINPGLIWIWSQSGQQVAMDSTFWNVNDNSSGAPGCLKLSYSYRLKQFYFKSSPCNHSLNVVCELLDNSISRALKIFEDENISVLDSSGVTLQPESS